jgi:hypothetical protein
MVDAAVEGRFTPVGATVGRVGGLLKPPAVLVRVVELMVEELVVDLVEAVPVAPDRRADAVPGAAVRFGAAVAAVSFFSAGPVGEAGVGAAAGSCAGGAAAGASACWTTSKLSTSNMIGDVELRQFGARLVQFGSSGTAFGL